MTHILWILILQCALCEFDTVDAYSDRNMAIAMIFWYVTTAIMNEKKTIWRKKNTESDYCSEHKNIHTGFGYQSVHVFMSLSVCCKHETFFCSFVVLLLTIYPYLRHMHTARNIWLLIQRAQNVIELANRCSRACSYTHEQTVYECICIYVECNILTRKNLIVLWMCLCRWLLIDGTQILGLNLFLTMFLVVLFCY